MAIGIGGNWILHVSSGFRVIIFSHGPTEVLVNMTGHGISIFAYLRTFKPNRHWPVADLTLEISSSMKNVMRG